MEEVGEFVDVIWDASPTSGVRYNVYRADGPGRSYAIRTTIFGATSFRDRHVDEDETYFYVVTALKDGVESVPSNEVRARVKD